MSANKVDVLVLGPTGYTGKLTIQYLASHPRRAEFSLGMGGRSLQKLQSLSKELPKSDDIATFSFDITNYAEVEDVVKHAKVIVNCIGPFWKWSTPVVRACAANRVHYVDITGEPWWIRELINDYDLEAAKNNTIIIPASGNDSIPSDLTVYLSAKALLKKSVHNTIGESLTAINTPDVGISGGTLQTIISGLEEVPRDKLHGINTPHWLSPVRAKPRPFRLTWRLPYTNIYGGVSPMGAVNEKIVYRTWGVFEARALSTAIVKKDSQAIRYGPNFEYEECTGTRSRFMALIISLTIMAGLAAVTFLPPVRWLLKKYGPQPGSGPEVNEKAEMEFINVSSTEGPNPDYVQTTVTFKGAPYPITAVCVAESALTILFDRDNLSDIGKGGGVLTSMSALGDSLVRRLVESGRVRYETKALHPNDNKKTT